jgi:hypothetical protein
VGVGHVEQGEVVLEADGPRWNMMACFSSSATYSALSSFASWEGRGRLSFMLTPKTSNSFGMKARPKPTSSRPC